MSSISTSGLNSVTIPIPDGSVEGFSGSIHPNSKIIGYFPKIYRAMTIYFPPALFSLASLETPQVRTYSFKAYVLLIPQNYDLDHVERIKKLINEFSETNEKIFPFSTTKSIEDVKDLSSQRALTQKVYDFCLEQLQIKKISIGSFTKTDLQVLRLTQERINFINASFPEEAIELKKCSCYEFALLRAQDRAVREQMFISLEKTTGMFERLERWGYINVKKPITNDLILYLKNGIPTHMGRYIGNSLVESKPGDQSTYYLIHSPTDLISDQYGSQIVYYHRDLTKKASYNEEGIPK